MGQERLGPSLRRFGALAPARVTGGEQTRSATGSAAPWHMHPSAQELLQVIEGALAVEVEGQGKALIEAGEAVIIPADLVHLARNESTTAAGKALVVHSRAAKDKPLTIMRT